jgi:hypothetical protein
LSAATAGTAGAIRTAALPTAIIIPLAPPFTIRLTPPFPRGKHHVPGTCFK